MLSGYGPTTSRLAPARPRSGRGGLPLILLLLVVAAAAGAAWWVSSREGDDAGLGRMSVSTVVEDLLSAEWTVEGAHPDRPPRTGVICPSFLGHVDGSNMPSLILAPPSEVRIPIGEAGVLRPRAGIHHNAARNAVSEERERVRFEVLLDGEPVFDQTLRLPNPSQGGPWIDAVGAEGLSVSPGQELILRTRLVLGDEEVDDPQRAIRVGFAGLQVEREVTVPRLPASAEHPNIILIVMDTLRADRLSAYGYARPTSPNLEELAARGVLFENAHATASWTWPATASLLTGLQPDEHGVLDETSCFLAQGLQTLPEILQSRGYTTIGWSSNPLISASRNFDQGFEEFDTSPTNFPKTRQVWSDIEARLRAVGDERFFLFLQLTDPHSPYQASDPSKELFAADVPDDLDRNSISKIKQKLIAGEGHTEQGEPVTERVATPEMQGWLSDLYDACVHDGDRALGALMRVLEDTGLSETTVVAFTSDHGEELFEHGLAAHGPSIFQESIRVPMVLAGPGIPSGTRFGAPVTNASLPATLAKIAGAPMTEAAYAPLRMQSEALDGDGPELMFSTQNGWWNGRPNLALYGLRDGPWILHYAPAVREWGVKTGPKIEQMRLYGLEEDPLQLRDQVEREPERAAEMLSQVKAAIDEQRGRRRSPSIGASEETLQLLQGIGYIDGGDD